MTKQELLQTAKPILFNTEMVQAILDGRKTVTRRVVKKPPHPNMPDNHNYCRMPIFTATCMKYLHYMDVVEPFPFKQTRYFESFAPYDKNDILYVRETWCETDCLGLQNGYVYKANNNQILDEMGFIPKWRPSIHMPKEAARIFLKVMDVRVERLQDIWEKEIIMEGINKTLPSKESNELCEHCKVGCESVFPFPCDDAILDWRYELRTEYAALWDSTIKKQTLNFYGWDANPWVWVIEFERIETDERKERNI